MRGSVVRRLLIIVPVVLALTLVSLFMPAQRVSIEGIGKLSFETTVTLSVGSEVAYASPDLLTNSPSTNTGSAWTNPTNAYADGTNYASITSGTPSGNNVWGTYGFNLTGDTITQVRVRYDAWSAGVASQTLTIRPTSDVTTELTTYPASPTTHYTKVDEVTLDATDYNSTTSTTYLTDRYGLADHTTELGTITNVTVNAFCKRGGGNSGNIKLGVYIGSTDYGMTEQTLAADGGSTKSQSFNTYPVDSSAWTWTEVDALVATGSIKTNGTAYIYQLWAVVTYTQYDDQIKVDVSWDGGTSWSSTQNTTLTSAEVTTWYDVTGATAWTPAKLADGQLQVRALAQLVNTAEVVNLDWLPVEVTYAAAPPDISNDPSSKAFGIVSSNSSYWSKGGLNPPTWPLGDGDCFFAVTNNSSGAVNISIKATNFIGGDGWRLVSTDPPWNDNEVRLKAGKSGDLLETNMVTLTTSDLPFITAPGLGAGLSKKWEIKLETGTFTDGAPKSSTITLTATYA